MALSNEEIRTLQEEMRRPEGFVQFHLNFDKCLSDSSVDGGIVFQNVAGSHYFLLEQFADLKLKFYHSSPSNGTRLAIADLSSVKSSRVLLVYLVWSPTELRFHIGALDDPDGELINSIEGDTDRDFQIDAKGGIVTSSPGSTMSKRLITEDGVVLDSTAIDSWNENIKAIEVLMKATSEEGYLFDVVQANFAAVALVTGIETYNKRRLQELESEGYALDFDLLEAVSDGRFTKLKIFAPTANYFQSLDHMKEIWKHLTGLTVAEIHPEAWHKFKAMLFKHRHVVVHAHSFRADLPMENDRKIRFITNQIEDFKRVSEEFITRLHEKTLTLPRRK